MDADTRNVATPEQGQRFDRLHIVLLVLVVICGSVGITFWVLTTFMFPTEFKPVTLSAQEEQVLSAKLDRLESLDTLGTPGKRREGQGRSRNTGVAAGPLEPERYSEAGATREIILTEKELNALLARNTDLATRLAIDLSGDLVSMKLLVAVDEDFPILGGRTLKVRAGVRLAYRDGKPVVALSGVSIMGIPVPNAWLGGIKNIDLVQEYGASDGFWEAFSEGVEDIRVSERRLKITLKE